MLPRYHNHIVKYLGRQGLKILSYMDDFGGIASNEFEVAATRHFDIMHATLRCPYLHDAVHVAIVPPHKR